MRGVTPASEQLLINPFGGNEFHSLDEYPLAASNAINEVVNDENVIPAMFEEGIMARIRNMPSPARSVLIPVLNPFLTSLDLNLIAGFERLRGGGGGFRIIRIPLLDAEAVSESGSDLAPFLYVLIPIPNIG
jgi:hypothetical protein